MIHNLLRGCFYAFRRHGLRDFKTENPKDTNKILLECIEPPSLKKEMLERIKLEPGLKKNVRLFITRLTEDRKACKAFQQQVTTPDLKRGDPPATFDSMGGGASGM